MPKQAKSKSVTSKARTLLRAGNISQAVSLLEKALAKNPRDTDALQLMAELAFKRGDLKSAGQMLRVVTTQQPDNVDALNKMAVVLALQSNFPSATDYLHRAIQIDPDCYTAHLDLCKVTREIGLLDQSIDAGLNAVRLNANDPRAHSSLALSYERFGLHQNAHTHYKKAAELAPNDVHRQFASAVSYIGIGDKVNAKNLLRKVIAMQPDHVQAHWMLAKLEPCTSKQDDRIQFLQSLNNKQGLKDKDRIYLHFALGKMHEDCKDYDTAFEHFLSGNRIENTNSNYNPRHYHTFINSLIGTYSCNKLSQLHKMGSPVQTPLFIVGLPRSGTTLVEQILAAHPEVYGAGELSWFGKAEYDLPGFLDSKQGYPECIASLEKRHIETLAGKYLAYLKTLSDGGAYRYITDKMPSNYERLGLITTLFPRARVIHCRRDPLDNAISQFCLLFQGSMDYSHDLNNLGTHYTEYLRLMSHWKNCLPETIIDIDYEKLVADHESEIRRLLTFLELPWNEACLNFFNARRAVRTSSDFQVRTPIYSSSVGRWKRYEKYLEPLKQGLKGKTTEAAKTDSAN